MFPKRPRQNQPVADDLTSLSTRTMAIIGAVIVNVEIYTMLVMGCLFDERYMTHLECSVTHFPMISDIGLLHPYDRYFCLALTSYSVFTLFPVARACYLKVNARAPDSKINDNLYVVAFILIILLPEISLFDEKTKVHEPIAVIFFVLASIYVLCYMQFFIKYRHTFSKDSQRAIDRLTFARPAFAAVFGGTVMLYLTGSPYKAFGEWSLVSSLTIVYVMTTYIDDYYDELVNLSRAEPLAAPLAQEASVCEQQ